MKLRDYLKKLYWWIQGKCSICHDYWQLCPGHKGEPSEEEAKKIVEAWATTGADNLDTPTANLTTEYLTTLEKEGPVIGE